MTTSLATEARVDQILAAIKQLPADEAAVLVRVSLPTASRLSGEAALPGTARLYAALADLIHFVKENPDG